MFINLLDGLVVFMSLTGLMQVFDNTPAAKDGTLESGDELVGVNGQSVKGKTKVEVAKMIQSCKVRPISSLSNNQCQFFHSLPLLYNAHKVLDQVPYQNQPLLRLSFSCVPKVIVSPISSMHLGEFTRSSHYRTNQVIFKDCCLQMRADYRLSAVLVQYSVMRSGNTHSDSFSIYLCKSQNRYDRGFVSNYVFKV